TLTGGDTSGSGGAILLNENLVLSDSILTGNASRIPTSTQGGGAIYSGYSGNLTVVRCVIANNSAAVEGGAIRKRGAQLVIEDSQIENNVAGWVGGGVSASDGDVNVLITRTTIRSNVSNSIGSYGGGGLFLFDAIAVVRDSLISGNTTAGAGGG